MYHFGDTVAAASQRDQQLVRVTSEGHFTHHCPKQSCPQTVTHPSDDRELHTVGSMETDAAMNPVWLTGLNEQTDDGINPAMRGGSGL